MPERHVDSPQRRKVLAGATAGFIAYSMGLATVSASSHETVEMVLDNVGSSAWELLEGDERNEDAVGAENPTLTLEEGTRYSFENRGGDAHPLAFRDSDGEDLLSQSGDGRFEDDEAVEYEVEGDELRFTLTADLAAEMATYVCTVHGSMEGSVETVADEEETDDTDDEMMDDDADDEEMDDTDDEMVDDDADDEEIDDVDDTDDADDDGPGFGPVAGAAGLSGLAAYAYRKLGARSDSPTPEDDGLKEDIVK